MSTTHRRSIFPGNSPRSGLAASRRWAAWLALIALAPSVPAQITFTARNGENVVYCGAPGSGLLIDHRFLTPDPTDDPITLSDPGDAHRPDSSASAHLIASGSPGRITIHTVGESHRGAPSDQGVYATADGRDIWEFTLSAATPFRLVVTMDVSGTEAMLPGQSFFFASFGTGAMDLSDGSTVHGVSHSLVTSGEWSMTYAGSLRAGQYSVGMAGRIEGNSSPFSGSFDHSVRLSVGCSADMDGDGFVTGDDFDAYVAAFEIGDAESDFNGDGFVTGDDFDGYVAEFEIGC